MAFPERLIISYRIILNSILRSGSGDDTWWTSLDSDKATVFELYAGRGASEQFHSEIKTDLDLERLPCAKFATNSLVLSLAGLCLQYVAHHRPVRPSRSGFSGPPSGQTPPNTHRHSGDNVHGRSAHQDGQKPQASIWQALPWIQCFSVALQAILNRLRARVAKPFFQRADSRFAILLSNNF